MEAASPPAKGRRPRWLRDLEGALDGRAWQSPETVTRSLSDSPPKRVALQSTVIPGTSDRVARLFGNGCLNSRDVLD